jgi:hypothetical protein
MTDITLENLVGAEDRQLDFQDRRTRDLFEPADPKRLAADLQKMAENRMQVAADAAALRLG